MAIGAFLWSTDSIFRAQVVGQYDATFIVLMNHLVCLPPVVFILFKHRNEFRKLTRKSVFSFFLLSAGSSVLAMILFTESFATAGNYTVPVLIQKIQPFITIIAARLFLKERLRSSFYPWALAAIIGTYFIAFDSFSPFQSVGQTPLRPMLLAFGSAAIWGVGTVAGRSLTARHSFQFVTAFRYLAGTIILGSYMLSQNRLGPIATVFPKDLLPFCLMAIGPGFAALWIYYRGLTQTEASVATLCELSFPLGAIAMNWIFLGSVLTLGQMVGAAILLVSVTAFSVQQGRRP